MLIMFLGGLAVGFLIGASEPVTQLRIFLAWAREGE